MIRQRKRKITLMRTMGTAQGSIFLTLLAEQMLLVVLGIGLGGCWFRRQPEELLVIFGIVYLVGLEVALLVFIYPVQVRFYDILGNLIGEETIEVRSMACFGASLQKARFLDCDCIGGAVCGAGSVLPDGPGDAVAGGAAGGPFPYLLYQCDRIRE